MNQFEIAERLQGLQEKFQVTGRDELADALGSRLDELHHRHGKIAWLPEILSLFLQLSDRPAQLTNVHRVEEASRSSEVVQSASPPPDSGSLEGVYGAHDENMWEHVDFAAMSSDDDDLSSLESEMSVPKIVPQASMPPEDEYVMPDGMFTGDGEDEEMITAITDAQFWRKGTQSDPAPRRIARHSQVISEAQVIRQTIFMLQGLPTSLFPQIGQSIEIDRRYTLSHSSNKALASLLGSFTFIGAKLNTLRRFTEVSSTIHYMQTFCRDTEECLQEFNSYLSSIEMQYLQNNATVSLLQFLQDVRRKSRLLLPLADLVSSSYTTAVSSSSRPAQFLDQLYELICISQATGDDDEFRFLCKLFFSCFETYIRPIQLWMETGCLDPMEGASFVVRNDRVDDLRTLWREWHSLDEDSLIANMPRFLHPTCPKIFKTGKTMFFLRQLDGVLAENLADLKEPFLSFEDLYPSRSPTPFYLPFRELLKDAFERLVDSHHLVVSNALQNELNQRCGLWTSLRALELIYLCHDMSIVSAFDGKVFELIDRGRGAWDDRFLLTDLARNTFGNAPCVDPSRLAVRSCRTRDGPESGDGRSVNALEAVSIDYSLAWPLANIITKEAIHVYQRVFTFLMRIRRAKYVTVRRQPRGQVEGHDRREDAVGYALRHHLLWFLNVLYGHMTDLVISSTTHSMHQDLASSADIDAMIDAHTRYISSLEEQMLLAKHLAPIYRAVIDLLDLCIRFADIQALRHGSASTDHVAERRDEYSDSDNEADTTSAVPSSVESPSYLDQAKHLKDQFDQTLAFLSAGLKEVARVDDGNHNWAILAEKLEWRNSCVTRI